MKKPERIITLGTFKPTDRIRQLVNQVVDSGQISYGPMSKLFEGEFARLHGCDYAILSNSGTSSLQVALQAIKEIHKIPNYREVIVPVTTFVATANIVIHCGLTPVFVDIDPVTYNMDIDNTLDAINELTCGIIPVHLFGQPADVSSLVWQLDGFGIRDNVKVIEDSCECMFVKNRGAQVGSIGDIGCFSTYVAHLIVTGVGGIATTNNPEYAAKMRSLVNHGLQIDYLNPGDNFSPRPMPNRRFKFDSCGHSYRITELEAALGVAQLENHHEMLEARERNARRLSYVLSEVNSAFGVPLQLPQVRPENGHAWMMYPIVLNKGGDGSLVDKEPVMAFLNRCGIETRDMLPILGQPIYRYLNPKDYPVSEWVLKSGFYVGCHQDLTLDDMDYVGRMIADWFESSKREGIHERNRIAV